jgi:hypothetical protein
LRRAEQERECPAGFGGKREPSQRGEIDPGKPGEHRAAGARRQRLLARPEGVALAARAHDHQIGKVDPGRGERGRERAVRRCDPGEPLLAARQSGERAAEHAQLADSFMREQQLGQRTDRPAAARKLRVERRETGRYGLLGDAFEGGCAPQSMLRKQLVDGLRDGRRGGHGGKAQYCMVIQ